MARATVRSAAVSTLPPSAVVPPNESRGARRRRLGIPRRITLRVVLFIVLVAAIPVGAFFAIRWYAYDNWFIAIQKSQIVVKQGHPGGVLWFHPRVVDKTKVTTSEILSGGTDQIRAGGVQEPSLQAAKRYVANLHDEYLKAAAAKRASQQGAGSSSTTTTFPGAGQTPTATGDRDDDCTRRDLSHHHVSRGDPHAGWNVDEHTDKHRQHRQHRQHSRMKVSF